MANDKNSRSGNNRKNNAETNDRKYSNGITNSGMKNYVNYENANTRDFSNDMSDNCADACNRQNNLKDAQQRSNKQQRNKNNKPQY